MLADVGLHQNLKDPKDLKDLKSASDTFLKLNYLARIRFSACT